MPGGCAPGHLPQRSRTLPTRARPTSGQNTKPDLQSGARRPHDAAELWTIADEACGAEGALAAEYTALAQAERDYRDQCRTERRRRQVHQAGVQAQVAAPGTSPAVLGGGEVEAWPDMTLASVKLAEELMAVVSKLVRMLGRRDAIRLLGGALAAAGVSGLDPDQYARLVHAAEDSRRVDAHVVTNLAVTLAHCKRQEDMLGPSEVLDTVVAHIGSRAGSCADAQMDCVNPCWSWIAIWPQPSAVTSSIWVIWGQRAVTSSTPAKPPTTLETRLTPLTLQPTPALPRVSAATYPPHWIPPPLRVAWLPAPATSGCKR